MASILTADAILFGILVFSGIFGNFLVIRAVLQLSLESAARQLSPSNAILVNLSLANLLSTLFRTVPIFVSDLGLELSLNDSWCRVFMLLWVWWRAVSCWITLMLSAFQCATLRRQRVAMGSLAQRRERLRVLLALGAVWAGNLALSLPALVYTTHVKGNVTVEVMVISCTTRPLLGCMWVFPSGQQAVLFASTSLAINEVVPLLLMVATNLLTLHGLNKHIRSVLSSGHKHLDQHVSTERKAGQVIMALVSLFVTCWVLQVAAVTYYNHNGGQHTEALLTIAHFSASLFVGFSPLVLAMGHSKLRRKIQGTVFGRCNSKVASRGREVESVSRTTACKVQQRRKSRTRSTGEKAK